MAVLSPPQGPVVLCIMDGVGVGNGGPSDAVALAHTPHLDRLRAEHAGCTLQAHGTAVGLPSNGDMGNSEVGHNALGCRARLCPGGQVGRRMRIQQRSSI